MNVVVTGMIATYPVGGVVWDYGQYALGLERMGFDVTYLEDTGTPTYDPRGGSYGDDPSYGVEFLAASLAELSPRLGANWHFRAADGTGYGLDPGELERRVADADLFLNVSGGCLLREAYARCRRTVLIDTDPGWNHFVNYPKWDREPGWLGTLGYRGHDHHFTYAERIGREGCTLPTFGLEWLPTRPPVVADLWQERRPGERWTTVMTWDNFRRPIEHEGRSYGAKEREFAKLEPLGIRFPDRLEVAVGGNDAPVVRWRKSGWSVLDSHAVSVDAEAYRAYIEGSFGELSVAKNVYVATRSGWFSCRSVCYLASGRPVVLQDTGFSEQVPCGAGILAFDDLESAAAALAAVEADYPGHCAAARRAAVTEFGHERVLGELLDRIGLG